MSAPAWPLQDAKNKFSAVVDAALIGPPQVVTRHGKPVVAVISCAELARLQEIEAQSRPTFIERLLAMPKGDLKLERLEAEARDVDF